MEKKLFIFLFIAFAGLFTFRQISVAQISQVPTFAPEPTDIVPSFACLGSCPTATQPTPTVAELLPDGPTLSPTEPDILPSVAISVTPGILEPTPGDKEKRRGEDRGLIKRLLRIIEELLKRQNPGQPAPSPTPSLIPTETPVASPSAEPTEEPTPTIEPSPTVTPEDPDQGRGLFREILQLLRDLFEMMRQLLGIQPDNPRRDRDRQDRNRNDRNQNPPRRPNNPGQNPNQPNPNQPSVAPNPNNPDPNQPAPSQPSQPNPNQPSTAPSPATGDTTLPSTPTNLKAASSGNKTINLNWSASTDNVRVTHYVVYRSEGNGANNKGITWNSGPVTGTSFTNTNLTPGMAYYYYVRAFDAAGNRSEHSNTAGVTLKK